jgi:hypothetical protein
MAWITVGRPNPFDRPPRPEDDPGWSVRQSIAMQIDREAAELPEKVFERLRDYRVLETLDRIRETLPPDDKIAVLHGIIDRLCSAIAANHCLPEPSRWVEAELQRLFRFAEEEAKVVSPAQEPEKAPAPILPPTPARAVKTKAKAKVKPKSLVHSDIGKDQLQKARELIEHNGWGDFRRGVGVWLARKMKIEVRMAQYYAQELRNETKTQSKRNQSAISLRPAKPRKH